MVAESLESRNLRLAHFIHQYFPNETWGDDTAIDVAMRLLEGYVYGRSEAPVFPIKATDAFAVETIRAHIRQCWRAGLYAQADQETMALAEFLEWQRDHRERVHAPDHKHVPHS